jgi:methyl-accepting chemotaxis protein
MQGFRNLKTAYKIFSLVLIMVLFMFTISYMGYFYYDEARKAMNEIYNDSTISLKLISDASDKAKASESFFNQALLAPIEANKLQQFVTESNILSALGDESLEKYQALANNPYEEQRLVRVREILEKIKTDHEKTLSLLENGDKLTAYKYYTSQVEADLAELKTIYSELSDFNLQEASSAIARDNLNFERAEKILFTLPILFGLLAITFGTWVSRLISKPLRTMLNSVDQLKKGNLGIQPLQIKSHDEVGKLALGVNEMLTSLRQLVHEVVLSSNQVTESASQLRLTTDQSSYASEQIASAMSEVASGTEKQSNALNNASTAIENISLAVHEIADHSKNVTSQVAQTEKTAREGQDTLSQAILQMTEIGLGTEKVHSAISSLSKSSSQISEITHVISSIAGQTNLLALNAAIEAARAGEQGRGFSVVAEEIRKLAEKAEEATREIVTLIHENQTNLENAILAMEKESLLVQNGIKIVNNAGSNFNQITDHIREIVNEIQTISDSIQHIAGISQRLVSNVQDTDQIGKETAAQAQTVSATLENQNSIQDQVNEASQRLAQLAEVLQGEISRFKL